MALERYTPENPNASTLEDLAAYVERELQRISNAFVQEQEEADELHVPPDRPQNGGRYLADGTDWDPGSGRGWYWYDSVFEVFRAFEEPARAMARLEVSTALEGIESRLEVARLGVVNVFTARQNMTLGAKFGNVARSNAETLDWYEEGTFTPVIEGDTTAGVGTYIQQVGRYTRIGNRVFISIFIDWSAHTGTGTLFIAGLPFVATSATDVYNFLSGYTSTLVYAASRDNFIMRVDSGTSRVKAIAYTDNNFAVASPIDTAARLVVSGSYEV